MMIFLKLLLSSGLIFIAATTSVRNESLCYQPPKYIKPMHYDVKLISYIEENIFYGESNISISILNQTQHIYISSVKLCIENIILFTNLKKHHKNDKDTIYKLTYNITKDTIDIFFINELSPGNYTLNIKYLGTADQGFRIFDMKKKYAWLGPPHFQIIDARLVFPCWHSRNLLLKTTFNISLGCQNCTTLSNMPFRNTERDEYNLEWKHYDTTFVMLILHATIIVSNYLSCLDYETRNIQMWGRFESKFHMEFAKNAIENITLFLKNEWKHSDNISMVSHVAIPNFYDEGTKVFGFVIYRETDIIYDKNLYPIAQKIEIAQLVGRKVTQEFYDLMNNPLRLDFWFNKGLITFLATCVVNEIYPDYSIINLFVVQNQHYSLNLDSDHMRPFTSQDDNLLKYRQSIRAPFILRMMQHVLTEEIFWKCIRSYVNSTRPHDLDFLNFTRHAALTTNLNIAPQLIRMVDWALEKYCPLIKVVRNYHDIMSEVNVSIQYIDTLNIDCLPVTFTMETSLDFNNFIHYIVCVSRDLKLSLPVSLKQYGWIIFNTQQIGYYRVNYDDKNWQRISEYLNSADYTKIHVLNRAQIIDDAFHLMITGQLNFSIFWNLTSYLHQEKDYIAWYPMFKALEYIFSTFPVAMLEDGPWSFKNRIKQKLHEILDRIKYEEYDDSDDLRTCLRQEAARWACFLGDITCKKEANIKLKQHIKDHKTHKLMPWWKEWTYCKGLMITTKEEDTWEFVYVIGLKKNDTKFLEYLACAEDTDVIKAYFTLKQSISTVLEYPNFFNSFLHIITKHAKNQTILEHLLSCLKKIKPKLVTIHAALIIIINNVYSVNQTKLIEEYVEKWKTNLADIIRIINNTKNLFISCHLKKDLAMQNFDRIKRKILIRNNQINKQIQFYESIRFNQR